MFVSPNQPSVYFTEICSIPTLSALISGDRVDPLGLRLLGNCRMALGRACHHYGILNPSNRGTVPGMRVDRADAMTADMRQAHEKIVHLALPQVNGSQRIAEWVKFFRIGVGDGN